MKLFALGNTTTRTLGLQVNSGNKQIQRIGALALLAAITLIPLPARAAEHVLAGIRVFASSKEVLARFGNPDQILTGANALNGVQISDAGASNSGSRGGMARGGMSQPSAGASPNPMDIIEGSPGGYTPPGANTNTSMIAGPTTGQAGNGAGDEVLYVYQRSNSLTLDFLLSSDGRVIQIQALGSKPGLKTEKAVTFGTDYKTIINRYGYPESQDNSGGVLTLKYLQKQHVIFQLRGNRVVGITVAAVE